MDLTAKAVPSASSSLTPPRAKLVLAALISVAAVANLNLAVANVALPDIGKAFDAGQTGLDLVAVGYSLGLAASVLYLGALGDTHGRKEMLLAGTALAIPASLVAGFAPSIEVLFGARLVGGLAAGMAFPTTLALITALWSGPERTKAIALWSALGGGISALGPLISGALLEQFDWGSVFFVTLPLAVVALAAIAAFVVRQRRAAPPRYDFEVAGRRVFWVAACAGIIVFGSLMAAMFVGQQYLQNVLGYSTLDAGLAILPGAVGMVLVAPRSAHLVETRGARFTLLLGYAFCLAGFVIMLLLWDENAHYWHVGLGYLLVGVGVGFAGTPASHSLTASVPVRRAGMASATADLQRDLGGAIMQSILGALLTAGYAAAAATAVGSAPHSVSTSVENELTKSFSSAAAVAEQHPRYAESIIEGARGAFLQGDAWAYVAGIVAICLGALLVATRFPDKEGEEKLLAAYASEDGTAQTG